jgi:hypothetical protein
MEPKPTDVELDIVLVFQTTLAIQVFDGASTIWLPKSQIVEPSREEIDDHENLDSFTIVIPEWLAKKKELI